MTSTTEYRKLIELLDRATQLASEFHSGHSYQFSSAEDFHEALAASIRRLKLGDNTQLTNLQLWFLPTGCWDDFIGTDGQDLANEISERLTNLTTNS